MKDGVKQKAEMWGSSTNAQTCTHLITRARIIAYRTDTHMQCLRTHSSGPLKLDGRLLLYRDSHKSKELLQRWSNKTADILIFHCPARL